jgi:hypothetical protein
MSAVGRPEPIPGGYRRVTPCPVVSQAAKAEGSDG